MVELDRERAVNGNTTDGALDGDLVSSYGIASFVPEAFSRVFAFILREVARILDRGRRRRRAWMCLWISVCHLMGGKWVWLLAVIVGG